MSSVSASNDERITIACLDFEGVLIPEVWIGVAKKTGIEGLKLTTRDIVDYDELMRHRLAILEENNLTLTDIQEVIDTLDPLEGAGDFLDWLRERCEVIILSDTFREFAAPLIAKLKYPTLFCHSLQIGENQKILNYRLRQSDQKRKAVKALTGLNFRIIAMGDSYNDISMLEEAHSGIFFRPTEKITKEYPQFPVFHSYEPLQQHLCEVEGLR